MVTQCVPQRREDNIRVFQDTERLCKENLLLREAILKSIKKQKMVSELEALPELEKRIYRDPADIVISKIGEDNINNLE